MSLPEFLILLVVLLAIWIVLKVARLAVRLMFFIIVIVAVAGVLWIVFSR